MEIESGVPIPQRRAGRKVSDHGALADKMKPGDSLLCKTLAIRETVRKRLWKRKWSTRMECEASGFWRVWRVA